MTSNKFRETLSIEFVRQCLRLDSTTGKLYWLERPRSHFSCDVGWRTFNAQRAGTEAFTARSDNGYTHGKIRCGDQVHELAAHRVVWALHNGRWPTEEIDHQQQNKTDHRPGSLREATRSQNAHNFKRSNATGFRGVNPDKWGGFNAKIRINGVATHLGRFKTPEEAHAAYCMAADLHYRDFAQAA